MPRLRCQNSSRRGLNYCLCASSKRGCHSQLPVFDEADRGERRMGREGSIGDMLGFAAWNRLLFPLQPLAIVTAKAVHGGPEEVFWQTRK